MQVDVYMYTKRVEPKAEQTHLKRERTSPEIARDVSSGSGSGIMAQVSRPKSTCCYFSLLYSSEELSKQNQIDIRLDLSATVLCHTL